MQWSLFTLASLLFLWHSSADPTPVVLWHGMGDTCCLPFSMGSIKRMIEKQVPGVFVHSIMIGANELEDEKNGFLLNVNKQIDEVCQQLLKYPQLAGGFNALGFSQGGQFLRAYVERCNNPKIKNLITFGGQHQGIYGFPNCPGPNNTYCEIVRRLLNIGAYEPEIQDLLVQAEYWQDPFNQKEYLEKNVFLPDINNHKAQKNATYKNNIISLENFVMVKFLNDTVVQPVESEWFGFYKEGSDRTIIPLRESQLYQEDWLGLQVLDKQNKLTFLSTLGDHLQFTDEWFIKYIIPYLNGTKKSLSSPLDSNN